MNRATKLLFLTLLFVGLVGLTFALNREAKTEIKTERKVATTWNYVGTANPGVFSDPANWEPGASTNPSCGENGNIPCQLTADATDKDELRDHLDGMSNNEVLDISDSKRN